MWNTGQLESCDLAPLPSLEATSSTPPTVTLEGNNVESTLKYTTMHRDASAPIAQIAQSR